MKAKLSLTQMEMLLANKPLRMGRLEYTVDPKFYSMLACFHRSPTLRKHFDLYLDLNSRELIPEKLVGEPDGCLKKRGRKPKKKEEA